MRLKGIMGRMGEESIADKAIAATGRSGQAYAKFLSANDAGLTGGHQSGILVGRRAWSFLFGNRDASDQIFKREVVIRWPMGEETTSKFTWYPSKGELRITCFGRGFPYLAPEQAGALFVLTRHDFDHYEAFILDGDDAVDAWLDAFQLSPVDLNQVITTGTAALTYGEAEEKAILEWVDELNLRDGGDFPKGETVSAKAREIQEKIYDHTEYLRINPDLKLIEYTRVEYALFRHMEQAKYMDSVRDGFDDLDAFVQLALSLLNSRKSRAGKGFENQIGAILTANGLLFQEQVKTEGSKRPDFVFPSGAAYHDMGRSPDKLVVLAAKTTCKDRWRQILTEAKRMENEPKWLITLQQGNSVQQLNEMMEDNVRLIVPEPYIRSYPAEYRGSIWPFKKFIGYVREHAQD